MTERRAIGFLTRAAGAGLALWLATAPGAATERREPFMRGMVVSCPRAGQIWGSEAMSAALTEIRGLGADWVALHPYAWVGADGTIRFTPAAETPFLEDAVARLRRAATSIFWKPHLGYWGSFEWRGDIAFGDDEAAWNRFFSGYREFIVDQARFAERHAIELFAVGVEYERTMEREEEWRGIVAAVRRVYSGRITYAANWDGLARVPFWDAVDVIGVHAYFPLATEALPDRAALEAGWDTPLAELAGLAARFGKPVVLAEIGYNRASDAASRPWAHGTDDTPAHRALRRALIEVALERLEREPAVIGMFWWKWMPGDRDGRDFSMKDPEAREAVARYWSSTAVAPRVSAN